MSTPARSEANAIRVQDAFTRQAGVFDALDREPLIQWVRDRVRANTLAHVQPGARMLEINAGTGIDSLWFAQHGLDVHATDAAPGMVRELERKRDAHPRCELRVTRCSFLELDDLNDEPADVVFSDFGGINCTNDLPRLMRGIRGKLRLGGVCALVIMPRTSPWELIDLLRGNFRHALRRYHTEGSPAWIEGVRFQCYYHDVSHVLKAAEGFTMVDRMGLSFFVPPPHLAPFASRHPRFVALMKRWEAFTCRWPFIRSRGDHYMLVLRRIS